ncbi:MAG: bifunctional [glutamine synthetase] adenylyltransferase/[glutamine synthetase]-adenylyl-L-tyrosine phosphorylase [Actinomycetes bacterium]
MSDLERTATPQAAMARSGFADPEAATRLTAELPGEICEAVLDEVVDAPDPDLALLSLTRLLDATGAAGATAGAMAGPRAEREPLVRALADDSAVRHRLVTVLGMSSALGEGLARHPEQWRLLQGELAPAPPDTLRQELLEAVGADPRAATPVAAPLDGLSGADALRIAYRGRLLRIAARDVAEGADVEEVAAELADLAAAALEAALAVARSELPPNAAPARLAVIGMGKCGGRELNYVSDVDVVFVAEPMTGELDSDPDATAALATATKLASALSRICSAVTGEGTLWPVDAALRPEGKAGPLVRTLSSHVAYYERWAKTWEFQALLKARPVAGDRELGQAYVEALAPLVWHAAAREHFVEDVQAMRRRVEEHIPASAGDRELKLGPGGLRDVEFSVQLLQLVHGRSDDTLRSGSTLVALHALAAGGYVGREDAGTLEQAYRFLRTLEHRIQLRRLRRTHTLPDDEAELRVLGRSLGWRTAPAEELTREWRRETREVRRRHEKLFYRPLLQAVARLDPGEARLTPEAAAARLQALGFADPAGALRHLDALTVGVSRRATIQRTLLPVMLGWFADAPDPDAGLLAFRQVSEALGTTPWYLRLLRDEGSAAERMSRLLATSRYASDLLLRAPEAVAMLGDDSELVPRSRAELVTEIATSVRRHDDPVSAAQAVRAFRRRELLRVAVADVLDDPGLERVSAALTDVAAATLTGALEAATRTVEAERRAPLPTAFAVIGMGRLGGAEMGYGSDADVLFVHDPLPGADEQDASEAALAVASELRRLLALPAPDPPLLVDADLRPEGRQGPLVRTLASYAAYYDRWALVWERQALLRAAPIAGDAGLGERFVALIDPLRYPSGGLSAADVREVRRIKARVEAERLPRGVDRHDHLKLGPGGLSDVEWTAQLLQLQHAGDHPDLRTTSTLPALRAAVTAGLLAADDAARLEEAWRLAGRIRNAAALVRGKAADTLPAKVRDQAAAARVLGYGPGTAADLVEDYRRAARRARAVVERVFYA